MLQPRSGSVPAGWSTSSRGGSVATWRRGASTTCVWRKGSRCGAAACWRPASAGPPTSLSPPCPGSRCRETRRHRGGTTPPTSLSRSCSRGATSGSRTAPGWASHPCRTGSPRSPPLRSGSPSEFVGADQSQRPLGAPQLVLTRQSTYRRTMQYAGNTRPRASLGRVLDDLGATLLDLAHGNPDRPGVIGGVVIHDPLDRPVLPPGALVLGVGLQTSDQVASLLRDLGEQGVMGLVVRAPVPLTDEVRIAADESGVAVLGLSRGAPWGHVGEMLRSLLAQGDVGVAESESLGGLPSGDLFAVANAVASLLDAPITIEDRNSRVLAFSGRQDEADPSRVETILGRQVPERYSRILHERGVFGELLRSDQPVFIEPPPFDENEGFSLPRVAIAVRAGGETLGSIWAAVTGPLSEERSEALRESAKLVALHLLRVRAGSDVQRRVRADLLSTALEGRADGRE